MGEYANRRWFTAIPLKYREAEIFWDRDAGLFCRGFRDIGVDARFVALGDSKMETHRPLVLGSMEQMSTPEFWRAHRLEGVVFYSWALPKYSRITKAIKQSGAAVVLPMDGDGIRTGREWFTRVLAKNYIYARSDRKVMPGLFALAQTISGTFRFRHRAALEHMAQVDFLAAQSPLALERFKRFFQGVGRPELAQKLVLLEHPIATWMSYNPAIRKQPLIIAVGGWERLVKGAPLLVASLKAALACNPEYRARIIGSGELLLQKLVGGCPESIRSRIEITGPMPNSEVAAEYQSAQIMVNTSHSEGFTLAVAEALCCGCSAVGSAFMSCMNYFCGSDSGTMATKRTVGFFQDALCAEMDAWSSQRRDPVRISQVWTRRLHATEIARRTMNLGLR
jgi:glycosyltransferase involved in cell wall biosynthesis